MIIELIAAMDRKRAIGRTGGIPWHLPADFKQFRKATTGHPIIMGHTTHQSIGRPLPGRTNIVLSRDPDLLIEGCHVCVGIQKALRKAQGSPGGEHVFVIGGAAVYRQYLPLADRIRLTLVDASVGGGDAFFPNFDLGAWEEVGSWGHPADEKHAFAFTVMRYVRI